jgi:hypothetical protein
MVGPETGCGTFLKSDPDPKLDEKWDPDPQQEVSFPQHFFKYSFIFDFIFIRV